ncbi:MAG: cation diffusion facilitator family transporter [Proteobacteria bacterium]|nr:cation diffusion facilitator family transporter [Pseudomonadota bacterium]
MALPVIDLAAPALQTRTRLMRQATAASVVVALTLVAAKLVAFVLTDSMAMLSTLIDSLLDVCASVITLWAVRQSLQPADREHRFGHGKAEPLAGLGQAVFIGGSAVFLFIEAGPRLLNPHPVVNSSVGVAVVVASMIATLGLVRFQASVVRRTDSLAVSADALHYRGDLLLNSGVLVALVAAPWLGWHWLDPLLALVIGGVVLVSAWRIVLQSLDMLMDHELADADRVHIRALCATDPAVLGVHDMRTRRAGQSIFIQLHLELDSAMTLRQANAIAHSAEQRIQAAFPGAEVLIHQDPSSEAPHATPLERAKAG